MLFSRAFPRKSLFLRIRQMLISKFFIPMICRRDEKLSSEYDEVISKISRGTLPLVSKLISNNLLKGEYQKTHMLITHGRGGGADQYVHMAAEKFENQNIRTFILTYNFIAKKLIVSRNNINKNEEIEFSLPDEIPQFISFLNNQKVSKIQINQTRFFPEYFVWSLPKIAKLIGADLEYFFHDFLTICPRMHLVNNSGRYCELPDEDACNKCLDDNGVLTTAPADIEDWRENQGRLLSHMKKFYAPSADTALIINKVFPDIEIKTVPHKESFDDVKFPKYIAHKKDERLRVAVVGALKLLKGADVVYRCIEDAHKRKLPIDFVIVGYSIYDKKLADFPNVEITGKYSDADIFEILNDRACHVAFFASVWPETFNFVFTRTTLSSLYPVAFDIGAIAQRIKAIGWGKVLPMSMIDDPKEINDSLLNLKITKPLKKIFSMVSDA
ncbi:glycosyltransferase [Rickettsiales bacterium]|nr:glycosyltransferase [Rickettsiales bacterium]